jgi:hypothetical protein
MKRSRWKKIALFSVLALAVGLVLFPFFKSKPVVPAASFSQATPTVSGQSAQDASIYKTDPRWVWWNEQNARDPAFEWKMPIAFYGKVVDQDNNPVEGVKIVFQWTDISASGTSERTVYSNDEGSFELTGVQGKRLGLTQIYKDGYHLVTTDMRHSFEYAAFFEENYHQPDAKRPVLFRLRKKGNIDQELTARRALMGIKTTGEPHYIDLQTTRKTAAGKGDIAISIRRTAPADVKQYDWSASIEGVNGAALLESTDEFMFEAPEAGYKPSYSYKFAESDPAWKNQMSRKYFVQARDGKLYGRLEISFIPKYRDTGAADIKFFVNPTGSRNLEFEPNTVLPR